MYTYWTPKESGLESERDCTALRPNVLMDVEGNTVYTRHVPSFPLGANVLEHTVRDDNVWFAPQLGVNAVNAPHMSLATLACVLFAHEGGQKILDSPGGRVLITNGLKTLWMSGAASDAMVVPVYLDLTTDLSVAGVLPVSPSKRNPLNGLRQAVITTAAMMDQSYPNRQRQGLPNGGGMNVAEGVSERLSVRGLNNCWKVMVNAAKSPLIPVRTKYVPVLPQCLVDAKVFDSQNPVPADTFGNVLHHAVSQMNGNHSSYVYARKLSECWVLGFTNRMGLDGFTVGNDGEKSAWESLRRNPRFGEVGNWDDVMALVSTIQFDPAGSRKKYVNALDFAKSVDKFSLDRVTYDAPASLEGVNQVLAEIKRRSESEYGKNLSSYTSH